MADTTITPGTKTSEFWMCLFNVIVGVATAGGLLTPIAAAINPTWTAIIKIAGLVLAGISGVSYTSSRTTIKTDVTNQNQV